MLLLLLLSFGFDMTLTLQKLEGGCKQENEDEFANYVNHMT